MNGILRPEARPRRIKSLTCSQRDALKMIVDALTAATEDVRNHGSQDSTAVELDETRASRIFFLSGEPGTGKTTVYLSLRKALELCTPEEGDQQIVNLRPRVVWLEPLNLEAVAGNTKNYLAAVLARIDQVLGKKIKRSSRSEWSSAPRLFEEAGLSEVLADFQRLRTEIGLAWDGNLPRRAEHLDPDVYAEEVMRAEAARIQVNRQFHEVLDDLTKKLYLPKEDPLFVLPIDDISLNPGPSLDILRLLRMISVPRLFILAIGVTEIFEELGFQKVLGELIGLTGGHGLRVERQKRVLMAQARQMSFQEQRRLLPPGQQIRLEALFWNEALRLKFIDSETKITDSEICPSSSRRKTDHDKPLWRLLADWTLNEVDLPWRKQQDESGTNANGTDISFLKFLGLPGQSSIDFKKVEESRCHDASNPIESTVGIEDAYTGMQILEIPYREALDFWVEVRAQNSPLTEKRELSKIERRRKRLDALFSWIAKQALRTLNEQNYMSNEDRGRCEDAIRGTQYTSMKLETAKLSRRTDYSETVHWKEEDPSGAVKTVVARTFRRWLIEPAKESPNDAVAEGESLKYLPHNPTAWFVLLHDLLVLTRGGDLQGEPLTPMWSDHEWAGVYWMSPYSDPWCKEQTVFVAWPVPQWPSFWHFDSFLCAWNQVVRLAGDRSAATRDDREQIVAYLAYWWIRLAVIVSFLKGDEHRVVEKSELENFDKIKPPSDPSRKAEIESDWPALVADLERLNDTQGKSSRQLDEAFFEAKRWLVHLCVMMAPESGLPKFVIDEITKAEWLVDLWTKGDAAARYVRQVRAKTMLQFMNDVSSETTKEEWNGLINREDNEVIFGKEDHTFNAKFGLQSRGESAERSNRLNPTMKDLVLVYNQEGRRTNQGSGPR